MINTAFVFVFAFYFYFTNFKVRVICVANES